MRLGMHVESAFLAFENFEENMFFKSENYENFLSFFLAIY